MEQPAFRRNTKIFFILFFLLFSISTAFLMWMEHRSYLDTLSEVKTKEQWAVQMESSLIYTRLAPLLSDISYLHDVYGDQLDKPENYDRIAQEWQIFSNKRHVYDQIRFIAANGDEKIRIDLRVTGSIRIPDTELQNKADRYYFYETAELPNGSVHISPLDLNIERNAVELPYKPMIRLGMPIHGRDGQLKGVIVMNYLAKDFLDLFKSYDQTTIGHIMLLNDKGYYLSSYREDQEWGFMFPDKQDARFSVDHPQEWQDILHGSHYVMSDDGMFTALHISPQVLYLQKIANQNLPQSVYSQDSWYIVSWIPKDKSNTFLYYNDVAHLFSNVATQMIFPILLVLTLIVAYLSSLGIRYYQKIHRRADFDTLTQAHSREGGLVRLQSLFSAAKASRFAVSLCFIDVNGLKEINDQLGHAYGDEMIKTAISIMHAEIRQNDFVIRYGGDEFILVLPYIDAVHAESVWKRITDKLDEVNEKENRSYLISLSHGIVDNYVYDGCPLEEMFSLADQKMYAEKQIIKKNFSSLRNPAKT